MFEPAFRGLSVNPTLFEGASLNLAQMFSWLSWCVNSMIQSFWSSVKVITAGQMFAPGFRVRSISPTFCDEFSWNFKRHESATFARGQGHTWWLNVKCPRFVFTPYPTCFYLNLCLFFEIQNFAFWIKIWKNHAFQYKFLKQYFKNWSKCAR